MEISEKTGEKIAIGMVILCVGFWLYFGYIAVQNDLSGKVARNNMCGPYETEIAGYCK